LGGCRRGGGEGQGWAGKRALRRQDGQSLGISRGPGAAPRWEESWRCRSRQGRLQPGGPHFPVAPREEQPSPRLPPPPRPLHPVPFPPYGLLAARAREACPRPVPGLAGGGGRGVEGGGKGTPW
jgi:hypothetical protein